MLKFHCIITPLYVNDYNLNGVMPINLTRTLYIKNLFENLNFGNIFISVVHRSIAILSRKKFQSLSPQALRFMCYRMQTFNYSEQNCLSYLKKNLYISSPILRKMREKINEENRSSSIFFCKKMIRQFFLQMTEREMCIEYKRVTTISIWHLKQDVL